MSERPVAPMDDAVARATDLIDFWTPLLTRLLIEGGVIAAFGHDARTAEQVASETGTHAPTIARILRALASRGVFEPCDGGRHRLTDAGRLLLPDAPGGVAGLAAFKSFELHAWAAAEHTLYTGEAAFPAYFGQDMFSWLGANPELGARFDDSMRRRTTALLEPALPLYDWPEQGTIVDVGGGNGLLIERVLMAHRGLLGVVFDQPAVVAGAVRWIRAAGLSDRVEVVGGDFFEEVPAGGDIYILASILHDWDDDDAVRILRGCRRAMPDGARLLLFEAVILPGAEPDFGKLLDLHMLVLFGARERTAEQWEALLADGGFALQRIVPGGRLSWIEGRPA